MQDKLEAHEQATTFTIIKIAEEVRTERAQARAGQEAGAEDWQQAVQRAALALRRQKEARAESKAAVDQADRAEQQMMEAQRITAEAATAAKTRAAAAELKAVAAEQELMRARASMGMPCAGRQTMKE